MNRVVLDASAVMAFFEDRAGAEKVEELIALAVGGKRELLMSVVNWGEVYYATWRERGRDAARKTLAEIAQLPIEIVDADLRLTSLAAELRARHQLPYRDCFAAALAQDRKASLITTDRDFSRVVRQVNILWASQARRD